MDGKRSKAAVNPADSATGDTHSTGANIPDTRPTGGAAANSRSIREPVAAATAVTEQPTAATMVPAPRQKASKTGHSDRTEKVQPGEGKMTGAASQNDADHLFVLLAVQPEIKSVSDLAGRNIAIDDRQSQSSDSARRALAAAGAADVQLSGGQTKALIRLIRGEVPAAVLTLAYPEWAEWFPEIAGFKVLRFPLAPRSSKPAQETAGNAADGSNAETIYEQVEAAKAFAERITAAAAVLAPIQTAGRSSRPESGLPGNIDRPFALLMARPEIKSLSNLASKAIAFDSRQFASDDNLRAAIVAAGASEVVLIDSQAKAIDRLIGGEVPAAVLTLVSQEAAEWFPEIAGFKVFRIPLAPVSLKARQESGGNATVGSHAARANIGDKYPGGDVANSRTRTLREQIAAATGVAEQVTASTAVSAKDQQASSAGRSVRAETAQPDDAGKVAPASNKTERLVALVMARLEIKAVSDLAGRIVAIDDRQSASNSSIEAAIVAAGATSVQLSEGRANAIDRVIGGEVPAAVLTLVSPDAAEWFPEIAGFRVFRLPLAPRSLKARL
ncbi:MAG: hypothetical protein WCE35_08695 [Bradyrhizobium sp.]